MEEANAIFVIPQGIAEATSSNKAGSKESGIIAWKLALHQPQYGKQIIVNEETHKHCLLDVRRVSLTALERNPLQVNASSLLTRPQKKKTSPSLKLFSTVEKGADARRDDLTPQLFVATPQSKALISL